MVEKTGSGKRGRTRKRKTGGDESGVSLEREPDHASMVNGTMSLARATMASDPRLSTWKRFLKELARLGRRRHPLRRLMHIDRRYALEWGLADSGTGPGSNSDLHAMCRCLAGTRRIREGDAQWLESGIPDVREHGVSLEQALSAIALASLLPELAPFSEESRWWHALRLLLSLTDSTPENEMPGIALRQLVTIELPLVLARQLSIVPACRELSSRAAELAIVERSELLDADGWLREAHVEELALVLASWTRCHCLMKDLGCETNEESQNTWEWFVRQSMRLMRPDGTFAFGDDRAGGNHDLIAAAARTSRGKKETRIARALRRRGPAAVREKRDSVFSEWAGLGMLRIDWSPQSPRLAVIASEHRTRMELCRERVLLTIEEMPSISLNGRLLRPIAPWSTNCDHSDRDVEYLELETRLETGLTVQRQILLARKEEFLYLVDVILGTSTERIDYSQVFRPASDFTILGESETRELYLTRKGKVRLLVLPLALPEWKTARTGHSFTFEDDEGRGKVTLSQTSMAQHMAGGLFIDLCARRSAKPRTWRQLAVGQSLQPVPVNTAVAWRVRVGDDQYVFYRTLAEAGNRTFLGQNFSGEFLAAKFNSDGLCEDLIRLDAPSGE